MADLLTRREAAQRLGISLVTLDELRGMGRIAFIQRCPGGKVFFTEASLQEYLARCTHPARPVTPITSTYRKRRAGVR